MSKLSACNVRSPDRVLQPGSIQLLVTRRMNSVGTFTLKCASFHNKMVMTRNNLIHYSINMLDTDAPAVFQ